MKGWSWLGYIAFLILIGLLAMFFVQMDYLEKGIPLYIVVIISVIIFGIIIRAIDFRKPLK